MKIKFYGNSGWITPTDEHSCFSVYTESTKILLDAGSPKILTLENIELNAIIITHIHFDHIKNLYNLLAYMNKNGRTKHLKIYSPVNLKGKISDEIIPNADDFRKFSYEFITTTPQKIGDVEIKTILSLQNTKPYAKVYSLKLEHKEKIITFVTDVSLTQDLIKFCKGTDVLVCDASATNEENCGHLSPKAVRKLIQESKPKKIVLTHFDEVEPADFVRRIEHKEAVRAETNLEINITH